MQKAIIIDDEPKGRHSLREKIKTYCTDIVVVAEASSGTEGIEVIEKYQPDIVFLDIEMPGMSGFEMLNELKNKTFQIIFTTAYDQYAIKAIKYAAFDYLLKPVDIDELKASVKKAESQVSPQVRRQLELLQQNVQHPKRQFHKLAIPTLEGLNFYNVTDIVHLEANSNYTNIYFSNKTRIIASKTLREFEELLPAEDFFRIHNSHVINLSYIKRYIKGDGGQIELTNGNFVDVSRRKKENFLKAIGY